MLTPTLGLTQTHRARQLGLLAQKPFKAKRWSPPPPPPTPSWKLLAVAPSPPPSVEELMERAEVLRREADSLPGMSQPSTTVKLGQLLLEKGQGNFDIMLKQWDAKGKGEFSKAQMRLNLRAGGLAVSSNACDALFDLWDEDGGGSLDFNELKAALASCMRSAEAFAGRPDPNRAKAAALRQHADLLEDAAKLTEVADKLERSLDECKRQHEERSDIKIGALLQARKIIPGQVVTLWASSSGSHAGELSKSDFRRGVLSMLASSRRGSDTSQRTSSSSPCSSPVGMRSGSVRHDRWGRVAADANAVNRSVSVPGMRPRSTQPPSSPTSPLSSLTSDADMQSPRSSVDGSEMSHTPSPTRPPRASASANWSIRNIDAIFDKYDEDGGGYMDEDEAKCMIRGLKETGQQAERDMRQLERETRAARALSTRKAKDAMEPPEFEDKDSVAESNAEKTDLEC